MNVQHLCRTCLTPSLNMHSLFDEEENGGVPSFVVHLLEKFIESPILPTDNASHNICSDCLSKLRETHSFMQKSKRSATTFQQLCSSRVRVKRLKDPSDSVEYVIVVDIEDLKLALENEIEKAHGTLCDIDDTAVEPVSSLIVESDEEVSSDDEEIGDEFYECPACLDAFGMISVLRTHLIEVHTSENSCIICNNAHFSNIWKHTKNHVPKKLACNVCAMQFIREDELQEHLQTHLDLPKPIKCDPYLTPLAFKLQSRKALSVAPSIMCQMCSKPFSSKSNCIRHMKNHCHANNLANSMCRSPFLSQQSYGSHILSQFNAANDSAVFPTVDENIVVMNEAMTDDLIHDGYTNLLQEDVVARSLSSTSHLNIEEIEL